MAAPRLCSIPECGKPGYARGWCSAHWARWKHHGHPLGGGTSPGEPQRYFYEVVLAYEGDKCLTWPYGAVAGRARLFKKQVSRLLCEHAYGLPPTQKHEAAHSCGNGHLGCVTKRHLSWKTHAENMADKLIHGTIIRGERQPTAKLTEADVREIRRLKGIVSQRNLAEHFGVAHRTIYAIQAGRKWAWLV